MLNSVRGLIRNIGAIGSGTWIHSSVQIGHWTEIGTGVRIDENVALGDWSKISNNCRIGPGTVFGSWASIGEGVTLGANVRLGSHTRIMDGVTVPDDAIFDDCDLVTPEGVIPNRNGGHSIMVRDSAIVVSAPFGSFSLPIPGSVGLGLIESMIDDYQWGRNSEIEKFLIEQEPDVEPDASSGMSM